MSARRRSSARQAGAAMDAIASNDMEAMSEASDAQVTKTRGQSSTTPNQKGSASSAAESSNRRSSRRGSAVQPPLSSSKYVKDDDDEDDDPDLAPRSSRARSSARRSRTDAPETAGTNRVSEEEEGQESKAPRSSRRSRTPSNAKLITIANEAAERENQEFRAALLASSSSSSAAATASASPIRSSSRSSRKKTPARTPAPKNTTKAEAVDTKPVLASIDAVTPQRKDRKSSSSRTKGSKSKKKESIHIDDDVDNDINPSSNSAPPTLAVSTAPNTVIKTKHPNAGETKPAPPPWPKNVLQDHVSHTSTAARKVETPKPKKNKNKKRRGITSMDVDEVLNAGGIADDTIFNWPTSSLHRDERGYFCISTLDWPVSFQQARSHRVLVNCTIHAASSLPTPSSSSSSSAMHTKSTPKRQKARAASSKSTVTTPGISKNKVTSSAPSQDASFARDSFQHMLAQGRCAFSGSLANPSAIRAAVGAPCDDAGVIKACLKALDRVIEDVDSEAFREPVDHVDLGLDDYSEKVPYPMDLGTVRTKLMTQATTGAYTDPDANCFSRPLFEADVKLVFDNCRAYNQPDSEIYAAAAGLERRFARTLRRALSVYADAHAAKDVQLTDVHEVFLDVRPAHQKIRIWLVTRSKDMYLAWTLGCPTDRSTISAYKLPTPSRDTLMPLFPVETWCGVDAITGRKIQRDGDAAVVHVMNGGSMVERKAVRVFVLFASVCLNLVSRLLTQSKLFIPEKRAPVSAMLLDAFKDGSSAIIEATTPVSSTLGLWGQLRDGPVLQMLVPFFVSHANMVRDVVRSFQRGHLAYLNGLDHVLSRMHGDVDVNYRIFSRAVPSHATYTPITGLLYDIKEPAPVLVSEEEEKVLEKKKKTSAKSDEEEEEEEENNDKSSGEFETGTVLNRTHPLHRQTAQHPIDDMEFEAMVFAKGLVLPERPVPSEFATFINIPSNAPATHADMGQDTEQARSDSSLIRDALGIRMEAPTADILKLEVPQDVLGSIMRIFVQLHCFWPLWGTGLPSFTLEELVAAICARPLGNRDPLGGQEEATAAPVAATARPSDEPSVLLLEQLHIKLLGFLLANDFDFANSTSIEVPEDELYRKPGVAAPDYDTDEIIPMVQIDREAFSRWTAHRVFQGGSQGQPHNSSVALAVHVLDQRDNLPFTWQWRGVSGGNNSLSATTDIDDTVDYCSVASSCVETAKAHVVYANAPVINALTWPELLCDYLSVKGAVPRHFKPPKRLKSGRSGGSKFVPQSKQDLDIYDLEEEESKDIFLNPVSNASSTSSSSDNDTIDSIVGVNVNVVVAACKRLVEALLVHPHAGPFTLPVDDSHVTLRTYYTVIEQPMDLGTVLERLYSDYYMIGVNEFCVRAFVRDVRQIWDNCELFHRRTSAIVEDAQHLREVFEERFVEIVKVDTKVENVQRGGRIEVARAIGNAPPQLFDKLWIDPDEEFKGVSGQLFRRKNSTRARPRYTDDWEDEEEEKSSAKTPGRTPGRTPGKTPSKTQKKRKSLVSYSSNMLVNPNWIGMRLDLDDSGKLHTNWRVFDKTGSIITKVVRTQGRRYNVYLHPDGTRMPNRNTMLSYAHETGVEFRVDAAGVYTTELTHVGVENMRRSGAEFLRRQIIDVVEVKIYDMVEQVMEMCNVKPDREYEVPKMGNVRRGGYSLLGFGDLSGTGGVPAHAIAVAGSQRSVVNADDDQQTREQQERKQKARELRVRAQDALEQHRRGQRALNQKAQEQREQQQLEQQLLKQHMREQQEQEQQADKLREQAQEQQVHELNTQQQNTMEQHMREQQALEQQTQQQKARVLQARTQQAQQQLQEQERRTTEQQVQQAKEHQAKQQQEKEQQVQREQHINEPDVAVSGIVPGRVSDPADMEVDNGNGVAEMSMSVGSGASGKPMHNEESAEHVVSSELAAQAGGESTNTNGSVNNAATSQISTTAASTLPLDPFHNNNINDVVGRHDINNEGIVGADASSQAELAVASPEFDSKMAISDDTTTRQEIKYSASVAEPQQQQQQDAIVGNASAAQCSGASLNKQQHHHQQQQQAVESNVEEAMVGEAAVDDIDTTGTKQKRQQVVDKETEKNVDQQQQQQLHQEGGDNSAHETIEEQPQDAILPEKPTEEEGNHAAVLTSVVVATDVAATESENEDDGISISEPVLVTGVEAAEDNAEENISCCMSDPVVMTGDVAKSGKDADEFISEPAVATDVTAAENEKDEAVSEAVVATAVVATANTISDGTEAEDRLVAHEVETPAIEKKDENATTSTSEPIETNGVTAVENTTNTEEDEVMVSAEHTNETDSEKELGVVEMAEQAKREEKHQADEVMIKAINSSTWMHALCMVENMLEHPLSEWFREPVGASLPGYTKVIKRPMDLTTVQRNVLSGVYGNEFEFNVDEFKCDVEQIFANCYKFNQPGSGIAVTAYNLQRYFEELVEHVRETPASEYLTDVRASGLQVIGEMKHELAGVIQALATAVLDCGAKDTHRSSVGNSSRNDSVLAAATELNEIRMKLLADKFQISGHAFDIDHRCAAAVRRVLAQLTDEENENGEEVNNGISDSVRNKITELSDVFERQYAFLLATVASSKFAWVGERILWVDGRPGIEGVVHHGVVKDFLAPPKFKYSQMKKRRGDYMRLRVAIQDEKTMLPLNLWTPPCADMAKQHMSFPNYYGVHWVFSADCARVGFATPIDEDSNVAEKKKTKKKKKKEKSAQQEQINGDIHAVANTVALTTPLRPVQTAVSPVSPVAHNSINSGRVSFDVGAAIREAVVGLSGKKQRTKIGPDGVRIPSVYVKKRPNGVPPPSAYKKKKKKRAAENSAVSDASVIRPRVLDAPVLQLPVARKPASPVVTIQAPPVDQPVVARQFGPIDTPMHDALDTLNRRFKARLRYRDRILKERASIRRTHINALRLNSNSVSLCGPIVPADLRKHEDMFPSHWDAEPAKHYDGGGNATDGAEGQRKVMPMSELVGAMDSMSYGSLSVEAKVEILSNLCDEMLHLEAVRARLKVAAKVACAAEVELARQKEAKNASMKLKCAERVGREKLKQQRSARKKEQKAAKLGAKRNRVPGVATSNKSKSVTASTPRGRGGRAVRASASKARQRLVDLDIDVDDDDTNSEVVSNDGNSTSEAEEEDASDSSDDESSDDEADSRAIFVLSAPVIVEASASPVSSAPDANTTAVTSSSAATQVDTTGAAEATGSDTTPPTVGSFADLQTNENNLTDLLFHKLLAEYFADLDEAASNSKYSSSSISSSSQLPSTFLNRLWEAAVGPNIPRVLPKSSGAGNVELLDTFATAGPSSGRAGSAAASAAVTMSVDKDDDVMMGVEESGGASGATDGHVTQLPARSHRKRLRRESSEPTNTPKRVKHPTPTQVSEEQAVVVVGDVVDEPENVPVTIVGPSVESLERKFQLEEPQLMEWNRIDAELKADHRRIAYLRQKKAQSLKYDSLEAFELKKKSAIKAIDALIRDKHSLFFREPVDAVGLGLEHYNNFAKFPMDLGTIRAKINKGDYDLVGGSAKDPQVDKNKVSAGLLRDLELIFLNCCLYNDDASEIVVMAGALEAKCNKVLELEESKYAVQACETAQSIVALVGDCHALVQRLCDDERSVACRVVGDDIEQERTIVQHGIEVLKCASLSLVRTRLERGEYYDHPEPGETHFGNRMAIDVRDVLHGCLERDGSDESDGASALLAQQLLDFFEVEYVKVLKRNPHVDVRVLIGERIVWNNQPFLANIPTSSASESTPGKTPAISDRYKKQLQVKRIMRRGYIKGTRMLKSKLFEHKKFTFYLDDHIRTKISQSRLSLSPDPRLAESGMFAYHRDWCLYFDQSAVADMVLWYGDFESVFEEKGNEATNVGKATKVHMPTSTLKAVAEVPKIEPDESIKRVDVKEKNRIAKKLPLKLRLDTRAGLVEDLLDTKVQNSTWKDSEAPLIPQAHASTSLTCVVSMTDACVGDLASESQMAVVAHGLDTNKAGRNADKTIRVPGGLFLPLEAVGLGRLNIDELVHVGITPTSESIQNGLTVTGKPLSVTSPLASMPSVLAGNVQQKLSSATNLPVIFGADGSTLPEGIAFMPRVEPLGHDRHGNKYWHLAASAERHLHVLESAYVLVELSDHGKEYLDAQESLSESALCWCGAKDVEVYMNRLRRCEVDLCREAMGTDSLSNEVHRSDIISSGRRTPRGKQQRNKGGSKRQVLFGHKESMLEFVPVANTNATGSDLIGCAARQQFEETGWARCIIRAYDSALDWYTVEYADGYTEDVTYEMLITGGLPSNAQLKSTISKPPGTSPEVQSVSNKRPRPPDSRRSSRTATRIQDVDTAVEQEEEEVANHEKSDQEMDTVMDTAASSSADPARPLTCTCQPGKRTTRAAGSVVVYTGRAQLERLIGCLSDGGVREGALRKKLCMRFPALLEAMRATSTELRAFEIPRANVGGARLFTVRLNSASNNNKSIGNIVLTSSPLVMGGCPFVSNKTSSAGSISNTNDHVMQLVQGDVIVGVDGMPVPGLTRDALVEYLARRVRMRGNASNSSVCLTVYHPGSHVRNSVIGTKVPGLVSASSVPLEGGTADSTTRGSGLLSPMRNGLTGCRYALTLLLSLEAQLWALLSVSKAIKGALDEWRWVHSWGKWQWPAQRNRWREHVMSLLDGSRSPLATDMEVDTGSLAVDVDATTKSPDQKDTCVGVAVQGTVAGMLDADVAVQGTGIQQTSADMIDVGNDDDGDDDNSSQGSSQSSSTAATVPNVQPANDLGLHVAGVCALLKTLCRAYVSTMPPVHPENLHPDLNDTLEDMLAKVSDPSLFQPNAGAYMVDFGVLLPDMPTEGQWFGRLQRCTSFAETGVLLFWLYVEATARFSSTQLAATYAHERLNRVKRNIGRLAFDYAQAKEKDEVLWKQASRNHRDAVKAVDVLEFEKEIEEAGYSRARAWTYREKRPKLMLADGAEKEEEDAVTVNLNNKELSDQEGNQRDKLVSDQADVDPVVDQGTTELTDQAGENVNATNEEEVTQEITDTVVDAANASHVVDGATTDIDVDMANTEGICQLQQTDATMTDTTEGNYALGTTARVEGHVTDSTAIALTHSADTIANHVDTVTAASEVGTQLGDATVVTAGVVQDMTPATTNATFVEVGEVASPDTNVMAVDGCVQDHTNSVVDATAPSIAATDVATADTIEVGDVDTAQEATVVVAETAFARKDVQQQQHQQHVSGVEQEGSNSNDENDDEDDDSQGEIVVSRRGRPRRDGSANTTAYLKGSRSKSIGARSSVSRSSILPHTPSTPSVVVTKYGRRVSRVLKLGNEDNQSDSSSSDEDGDELMGEGSGGKPARYLGVIEIRGGQFRAEVRTKEVNAEGTNVVQTVGRYRTEVEAAAAHDIAVRRHYGRANTNNLCNFSEECLKYMYGDALPEVSAFFLQ